MIFLRWLVGKLFFGHYHLVAATGFGLIKSFVGKLNECQGFVHGRRINLGDANAYGAGYFLVGGDFYRGSFDGCSQFFCKNHCAKLFGLG